MDHRGILAGCVCYITGPVQAPGQENAIRAKLGALGAEISVRLQSNVTHVIYLRCMHACGIGRDC